MPSDIVLNDYSVGVVGVLEVEEIVTPNQQLKVGGYDLILDCKERRNPTSQAPFRRALVHDIGDRLVINACKDYPTGVFIDGDVQIGDCLKTDLISSEDPSRPLKVQGKIEILGEIQGSSLRIDGIKALDTAEGGSLRINHQDNSRKSLAIEGDYISFDGHVLFFGPIDERGNPTSGYLNFFPLDNRIDFCVKSLTLTDGKQYGGDDRPNLVALEHSDHDELIINKGQSYKGGVILEGSTNAKGNLTVEKSEFIVIGKEHSLSGHQIKTGRSVITITGDTIILRNQSRPPVMEGATPSWNDDSKTDLIAKINELENRIAALETKIPL